MASFAEQVKGWEDRTLNKLELVYKKVSLEAFRDVILMSPVDTGRFRGNWQCAVGPGASFVPDTGKLDPNGATALAGVQMKVEGLKLEDSAIWLVNNLPYARRLEYGWSKQAPGGMVRLTAQRWQPIVNQAVAQVKNS